jgi:cyclase
MVFRTVSFALAVLVSIGAATAQNAPVPAPADGFALQRLADGVYAAIRNEPPGFAVDANALIVVNDEDVLVVDANDTPSSAKEVIAAIRTLTARPVRFVVNTHWHDDHIMGNQTYRDAYPGVDFVAHESMREYLPTAGVAARRQMLDGATQFRDFLRGVLEKNTSIRGGPLSGEERESHRSDIGLADRYIAESPGVPIVSPTVTIQDRLTLYRGRRVIEILHLGRGHTRGDVVVHLPVEGIVAAGDLVVWPVPLVGADQSYVADWGGTLDKLVALHAKAIVPGHGPVLRDDAYPRRMASLFRSVTAQAQAAIARGETEEQARKSVRLDDFRGQFAGDSMLRKLLFDNYVAGPSVGAIYRESKKLSPPG